MEKIGIGICLKKISKNKDYKEEKRQKVCVKIYLKKKNKDIKKT